MDPRTRAKGLAHRRPASPAGAVTRFEAEPSAAMPSRMRHRGGAANPAAPIADAPPCRNRVSDHSGSGVPTRDPSALQGRRDSTRMRSAPENGRWPPAGNVAGRPSEEKLCSLDPLGLPLVRVAIDQSLVRVRGSLKNTAGKSVSRAREPKGVQTRRPARDYIAAADNGSSSTSRALDSSS